MNNRFLKKALALLLMLASLVSLFPVVGATDLETAILAQNPDTTIIHAEDLANVQLEVSAPETRVTDANGVMESNKTLTHGATVGDDEYLITLDALSHSKNIAIEETTPVDVTIVIDRSESISQPANWSDTENTHKEIKSEDDLKTALGKLDTSKPDGYYVASNWLNTDWFGNEDDPYAKGYVNFGRMKYNSSKKRWECLVSRLVPDGIDPSSKNMRSLVGPYYETYSGSGTASTVSSTQVQGDDYSKVLTPTEYKNGDWSKNAYWMPVTDAYNIYVARQKNKFGKFSYPFVIAKSKRAYMSDAVWDFVNKLDTNALRKNVSGSPSFYRVSVVSFGAIVFEKGVEITHSGVTVPYPSAYASDYNSDATKLCFEATSATSDSVTANKTLLKKMIYNPYCYGYTRTDQALAKAKTYADKLAAEKIARFPLTAEEAALVVNQSESNDVADSTGKYFYVYDSNNEQVIFTCEDGLNGKLCYTKNETARTYYVETTRKSTVVLFTDGAPTSSQGFHPDIADAALESAYAIKNAKTTIFSVGLIDGLDSSEAPNPKVYSEATDINGDGTKETLVKANDTIANANAFLHYVSSNYPEASAMDSVGNDGNPGSGNYMSSKNGSDLANHFTSIFTKLSQRTVGHISQPIILKDVVTDEFIVDKDNIKVYYQSYDGVGGFDGEDEITNSLSDNGVKKPEVTVNDKGQTEITVEWTNAPSEYLRTTATDGNFGKKLIVKIPIKVDRDNIIGGNNVPTNTTDSGASTTSPDIDLKYPVPNVNIPIIYNATFHDYFMEILDAGNVNGIITLLKTDPNAVQTILQSMYSVSSAKGSDGASINGENNEYVNISVSASHGGTSYTAGTANAGATAFTAGTSAPSFALTEDQTVGMNVTVTPISGLTGQVGGTKDTLGQDIIEPTTISAADLSYYAPKLVVLDFGNEVKLDSTFMGKEATKAASANAIGHTIDSGETIAYYENDTLKFDFADNHSGGTKAASPNYTNLETVQQIDYTMTTKYPPKGKTANAGDYYKANRTITVIPANNVYYDQRFIDFGGGTSSGGGKLMEFDPGSDEIDYDWLTKYSDPSTGRVRSLPAEYDGNTNSIYGNANGWNVRLEMNIANNDCIGYTLKSGDYIEIRAKVNVGSGSTVTSGKQPSLVCIDTLTTDNYYPADYGISGTVDLDNKDFQVVSFAIPDSLVGQVVENIQFNFIDDPIGTYDIDYEVDWIRFGASAASATEKATWSEIGSMQNVEQTYDNGKLHGQDTATFAGASAGLYSYGSTMKTTVTAEMLNAEPATFSFYGSGFDLMSQTDSSSGAMLVTVTRGDGVVARRYIVQNHLAGEALYQLPVVRFREEELPGYTAPETPNHYTVTIQAFYDRIFDIPATTATTASTASAAPATRGGYRQPTEAEIRRVLGLSETEELTLIGFDTAAAPATRTAAGQPDGEYSIYIDGVRIYNPLGKMAFDSDGNQKYDKPMDAACFGYTYKFAAAANVTDVTTYNGELNPTFFNVREHILTEDNWKESASADESTAKPTGIAYIAGGGTAQSGDYDSGIHLNMEGMMLTQQSGDRYFLKTPEGGFVMFTDSKGNNGRLFYKQSGDEDKPYDYYILVGTKEIPISDSEARKAALYYSPTYDVKGPKNEVYLTSGNGIAFKIEGYTSGSRVHISIKNPKGGTVALQAWNNGFADVPSTYFTGMETYYDVTNYVLSDGSMILKANGDGILSICNIKVLGAAVSGASDQPAEISIVSTPELVVKAMCAIRGIELPVQQEKTFFIKSLNLQSYIGVDYTVKNADLADYDSFYVGVKVGAGEEQALEGTSMGDAYTYFELKTYAAQMTENLTATLYGVKDGETTALETSEWSVREGVMDLIEATEDAAKLTLMVDMLKYGAAAQNHFGIRTDDLADSALTEEHLAYATAEIPELNAEIITTSNGDDPVTFFYNNLSLQSAIELHFMLKLNGYAAEELVAKITVNGTETELPVLAYAGRYGMVKIDNLGCHQLRDTVTVTVCDKTTGDAVSATVACSAEALAKCMDASMADMITAMMRYSDSARAYAE